MLRHLKQAGFFLFVMMMLLTAFQRIHPFDLVILKYKGGDYYNARSGAANFLAELKKRTTLAVDLKPSEISLEDESIFQHAFLFLNGHIPLELSAKERLNLRRFVLNGGFVFANDDFGMDESFRRAIGEVFRETPLKEIPFDHPVYSCFYKFPEGIPKIHEHYEGAPKAYGIFVDGRIALYYAFNTDIADGWDFPEVHNDPSDKREAAIRMGVNIAVYSVSY